MRALLRKEWLSEPNKFGNIILFVFWALVVWVIRNPQHIFFMVILPTLPGFTAADKRSGWEKYAAALPVGRGDIVRAKYITMAVHEFLYIAAFATGTAASVISGRIGGAESALRFYSIVQFHMINSAVQYAIFRLDMNNSRIRRAVTAAGVALWVMLCVPVSYVPETFGAPLPAMLALAVAAVLIRIVSARCAVRAYGKRDM